MQAVVLVTHLETEPIYKHFLRLKVECRDHLDAYFCVHMSPGNGPEPGHGAPADFRPSASDEAAWLPARHAEKIARGGAIMPGFCDLTYMPALLGPRLANYTHVWIVEYDVDYAGRWDRFFVPLAGSEADLIGTTFYPKDQSRDWMWWPMFEAPPSVSRAHYTRSFIPIVRLSRRMILQYENAVHGGEWRGHRRSAIADGRPCIMVSRSRIWEAMVRLRRAHWSEKTTAIRHPARC